MKRLIYFALMLAIQLNGSFAYTNSPLNYVYVIEKNGIKSEVLGTIHAGIRLQDMPPKIMEIISSAKRLVVENNAETRSQAVQLLFQKELEIGFSPENLNSYLFELSQSGDIDWSHILPHEMTKYEFIYSHLKSPVSVSMLLSNLICLPLMKEAQQTIMLDDEIVTAFKVENYYNANENYGVIHYLDSLENLIETYKRLFNPQRNSVILANYQRSIQLLQRMVQDYRNGKKLPESLEAYIEQQHQIENLGAVLPTQDKEIIDFIWTFRNSQWLPLLKKVINEGEAFVAIGLGHLIGKNGILNLLKQDGYKVTPLEQ